MSETKHAVVPPEGTPKVGADDYPLLRKTCSRYLEPDEMAKVDMAYRFAAEFHKDQKRRSGEAYINHPVEVALILAHELHMDEDAVCAALLHDTVVRSQFADAASAIKPGRLVWRMRSIPSVTSARFSRVSSIMSEIVPSVATSV